MSTAVTSFPAHQDSLSPVKMLHLSARAGFEGGMYGVRIRAGYSPQSSRPLDQIGHVMHSPDNVVDVLTVPVAKLVLEDSAESGLDCASLSTRLGFAAEQFVLNKFAKDPSEILQVSINWWKEWWALRKLLWRCRIAIRSRHVHIIVRSCFQHWTHFVSDNKDWWKLFTRVVRWRARNVQVGALRSWRQATSFGASRAAANILAIRFRAQKLISIAITLWQASTEEAKIRRAAFAQGLDMLQAVLELQLLAAVFEAWNRELVAPVRCARVFADIVETRKTKRVFHLVLCALAQNVQKSEDDRARQQQVDSFTLQLRCQKSRAVLTEWASRIEHLRAVEETLAAESVRIREEQLWKRLEANCEGAEAALDRQWNDSISRQRTMALARRGLAGFALARDVSVHRRRAVDAGVALVSQTLKKQGLRCWVRVCRSTKEEQTATLRAERHRARTSLGIAMSEWRLCVLTQREGDLSREKADYWYERNVCLRVLRCLQAETAGRRQLVAKGRIAARHRYRRQLTLSFRVWGRVDGKHEAGRAVQGRWEFPSFVAAQRGKRAMLREAEGHRSWQLRRRVLACVRAAVEAGRAKRQMEGRLRVEEERRRTEGAFWNWIAAIGERARRAQSKMVVAEHWRARSLRAAWESARAYAAERALRAEARRRRLGGLVLQLVQAQVRRLWDAWQEAHAHLTMQRFACVRARSFRETKLLQAAWRRLSQYALARRARGQEEARAVKHRQTQLQRKVAAAWFGAREDGIATRELQKRGRELRQRRVGAEYLADWKWYTGRRKSKVQREKAAVEERRVWLLRQGAARMARAGLEAMRRREEVALLSQTERSRRVYLRVARIARHWLALTLSRRAHRRQNRHPPAPPPRAQFRHHFAETFRGDAQPGSMAAAVGPLQLYRDRLPELPLRPTALPSPPAPSLHRPHRLAGSVAAAIEVAPTSRPPPRRPPCVYDLGGASGGGAGPRGSEGGAHCVQAQQGGRPDVGGAPAQDHVGSAGGQTPAARESVPQRETQRREAEGAGAEEMERIEVLLGEYGRWKEEHQREAKELQALQAFCTPRAHTQRGQDGDELGSVRERVRWLEHRAREYQAAREQHLPVIRQLSARIQTLRAAESSS